MDNRKQAIIAALRAFIEQRPGFDWHNYATASDYRSDQRQATRQLHDARQLLRAVELRDSISADDILREAASGGRVTIKVSATTWAPASCPGVPCSADCDHVGAPYTARVDYCPGQYWCTEFRAGACRLLASVLWTWMRGNCMPTPCAPDGSFLYGGTREHYPFYRGGGLSRKNYDILSAGDWLRASFRREFGRPLAGRWFA